MTTTPMPINDVTETPAPAAIPVEQLGQLLFGKHVTYCISAIARLGVADQMNSVPVSVDILAQRVGADAPSLYRVMRALSSVGVFNEAHGRRFSLTPVGELLKTDAPGSLRYLAIQFGEKWSTRGFERFAETVRTGVNGIRLAFDKEVFDLLTELPEEGEIFQRSMSGFSKIAADAVLEAYSFEGIQKLGDVGGGHGTLLASIVRKYPAIQGIVYDLPEVVAGIPESGELEGCEDRVETEAGSFFERVPGGCDAYLMKHILHDWSDAHCRRILELIREQLPENGRVIVCEMVIPETPAPVMPKLLDIEMLALTTGGRERSETEFRELFASAGLRLHRIVPTSSPICVIEARP